MPEVEYYLIFFCVLALVQLLISPLTDEYCQSTYKKVKYLVENKKTEWGREGGRERENHRFPPQNIAALKMLNKLDLNIKMASKPYF